MEQQERHDDLSVHKTQSISLNEPSHAPTKLRTHNLAYRRNAVISAEKAYKSRKEAYELMRHNYEQKIAIIIARNPSASRDRVLEEIQSSLALESALAIEQLNTLRERLAKMKRKLTKSRAKEEQH